MVGCRAFLGGQLPLVKTCVVLALNNPKVGNVLCHTCEKFVVPVNFEGIPPIRLKTTTNSELQPPKYSRNL